MNEFEKQLLDEVHDIKVELTEVKGDVKTLTEKVEQNGEKVDRQTETETKRLDKHSDEIDEIRDDLIALKTTNKNNKWWFVAIAVWATAIAAIFGIFM